MEDLSLPGDETILGGIALCDRALELINNVLYATQFRLRDDTDMKKRAQIELECAERQVKCALSEVPRFPGKTIESMRERLEIAVGIAQHVLAKCRPTEGSMGSTGAATT